MKQAAAEARREHFEKLLTDERYRRQYNQQQREREEAEAERQREENRKRDQSNQRR